MRLSCADGLQDWLLHESCEKGRMIFGWIFGKEISDRAHYFGGFAAEIAFFFALSLAPFLALTLKAAHALLPLDLSLQMGEMLRDILPMGARIDAMTLVEGASGSVSGGWVTAGVCLAFWTSLRFVSACLRALRFVTDGHPTGGDHMLWRAVQAVAVMGVWMMALVLTSLVLLISYPVVEWMRQQPIIPTLVLWLWHVLRPLVFYGMALLAFCVSLRVAGARASWKNVLVAASCAAVGWVALGGALTLLMPLLWGSNQLYGTLGSIIAFLVWAYANAWVLILAGCLVACYSPKPEKIAAR